MRRSGSSSVTRRSQSEPIFTWVTSSASIQSSQNSRTGSVASSPNSFIVVNTSMASPSSARLTPARRSTGSLLQAASNSTVFSANWPISVPIQSRQLDADLDVAGLVPRLAGHVELQRRTGMSSKSWQVRPAPSSAWISPTKIPCISERAASADVAPIGHQPVGRAAAGCSALRVGERPRVGHPVAHRDPVEPLVAGEVVDGEELPHGATPPRLGLPIEPGPAMPPASTISFSSRAWWAVGPVDLVGRLDQRLQQHLAIAPVVELVLQDELQRADRRGVGDLARVVEVERVRGDEVRDEDPVDADQLLDRQLGSSGSVIASTKRTIASLAGWVSRSGFISRSSGRRLCHSSACQACL